MMEMYTRTLVCIYFRLNANLFAVILLLNHKS
jgi:hypothetical protein